MGKGNYPFFCTFVFLVSTLCFYTAAFSVVHVVVLLCLGALAVTAAAGRL